MDKKIPNKLFFKIGEVCEITDTQPYVLRYWESEFPALAPAKNSSGQRIYRRRDIETVLRIKQLLYEEGYTIAGAKKKLETELAEGSLEASDEEPAETAAAPPPKAPRKKAAPPEPPAADIPPALDSDTAERVQTLRSGIEKALEEARELLALLDSKSP